MKLRLIQHHQKRASEGSGVPWGENWEPCWPPGAPRSPNMSENHVRGPPGTIFCILMISWCCFFRRLFWRVPGSDLDSFWYNIQRILKDSLDNLRCTLHMANLHSVYCIYSIWGTAAFKKSWRNYKFCEFWGTCLRYAFGDDFKLIVLRFWVHFRLPWAQQSEK